MKITCDKALAHLRVLCHKQTQKEVAMKMGVSPQYLNDILYKRRNLAGMDNHALAAVGLRKQVIVEWDLEVSE